MELQRNGYGSNFNKLYVDISENTIQKKCYNSYGMKKISNEIHFIHFINDNNINFPIPKMHAFLPYGYVMEYMKYYIPLYQIYNTLNAYEIQFNIKNKLGILHSFDKIITTRENYIKNVLIETKNKLYERYEIIKPIVYKYNYINSVNDIYIYDFNYIVETINSKIINIIKLKTEYHYVPIHGDCQFNNILINPDTNDICFIDPRGYFGNLEIFGIEEYDFAKILFALSGYDHFDNSDIAELSINDNNVNIQINILDPNILDTCDLQTLLMLTVWLGNAHCFIQNENKLMNSYFIAMYYCSLFLKKHLSMNHGVV